MTRFLSYLIFCCIPFFSSCSTEPAKPPVRHPWEWRPPEIKVILPPEVVIQTDPVFDFRDTPSERRYYIRSWDDQDVVTVKDPEQPERMADPLEREYALAVLEARWRSQNLQDKLDYHSHLRKKEETRNLTLLEDKIHYKHKAIQQLKDKKFDVDARIRANVEHGIHPDETEALKHHSSQLAQEIAYATAQLRLLEYQKELRDSIQAEELTIAVLSIPYVLEIYRTHKEHPEEGEALLLHEIKQNVAPESWQSQNSRLEIRNVFLIVRNTKKTVEEVKTYVDGLTKSSK